MSDHSPEEASELIDEIINLIEEEVPEEAWDRAAEFFENVKEKAIDVGQTIMNNERVSEKQWKALEGWKAGVKKWIRDN